MAGVVFQTSKLFHYTRHFFRGINTRDIMKPMWHQGPRLWSDTETPGETCQDGIISVSWVESQRLVVFTFPNVYDGEKGGPLGLSDWNKTCKYVK